MAVKTGTGIIDITVPISNLMPTWPGDPGTSLLPAFAVAEGDASNVSSLCLSTHTGTHIDPPAHLLPGGTTIDQIPLQRLIGECRVVSVGDFKGQIGPAQLEEFLPLGTERLIFKTPNSYLWDQPTFFPDYVSLSREGAEMLIDSGVRLVGIDYLSIEAFAAEDHPVHRRLMEEDVIILEGLDLREVEPGHYGLTVLPLRILGGDGAPARAILEHLGP